MEIFLLVLPATLPGRCVTLGFKDEEFEEQRGVEVCLRSHSQLLAELEFELFFV